MVLKVAAVSASLGRPMSSFGRSIVYLVRRTSSAVFALVLCAIGIQHAHAQSTEQPAPLIVTAPVVDFLDENHVSIVSGKVQFTIPALKMGDVSFVPYAFNGHFGHNDGPIKSGVADHNYGYIAQCGSIDPNQNQYAGAFECSVDGGGGIQAVYGEERATFTYGNPYYAYNADGSTFADNGSTCTWTKKDGTQVIYAAYHTSGNPICKSNNISKIVYPDGRIATYYYYGSFATNLGGWTPTPILSIATSSGYLLKYIYSGTPTFGNETSVTAINRAFETCDPAALTCTLSQPWPTAQLSFTNKTVIPADGFPLLSPTYSGSHHVFTIEEASHRKHVFELDSYFRVISYQPPEATSPQYTYNLCSNLANDDLRNCQGWTHWYQLQPFDEPPLMFDQVTSALHGGQTWRYEPGFTTASLPHNSSWDRWIRDPRGGQLWIKGNSTPGTERVYGGSIQEIDQRDGTIINFAYSVASLPVTVQLPSGIKTQYEYDDRSNVTKTTRNPVASSGLPAIIQSANYSATCANAKTCNKPNWVIDGNGNQTDFTYDPSHGGTLTVTSPAVAGGRPEMRYTYTQRQAWYLGSNGVMAADPNPIWVLSTESMCVQGGGCTMVTTYDYGPSNAGPNNLLVRGKTVVADQTTLRTCYGHDKQGNKIWETTPNAIPSSCPAY